MLKITRVERPDSALTFKLEGRLLEPWVAEVRDVCTSRDGRAGRTSLDLSGVTFVDQAGVRLLRDLVHRGIGISAMSGFVAELLHLEDS
jgi:anti-anti-sigma regulatory factor